MTATELKKRAIALAEKTKIDSVTPEEVGQLSNDIVEYIENVEINGSSLGIRKTYTSVSAMEADSTAPKDDKGVLLRRGMLVNIYNQSEPDSADNGKVFSFQNPGWAFRGTVDAGYATKEELTELSDNVDNKLGEVVGVKNITIPSTSGLKYIDNNIAVRGSIVTFDIEERDSGCYIALSNTTNVTSHSLLIDNGGTSEISKKVFVKDSYKYILIFAQGRQFNTTIKQELDTVYNALIDIKILSPEYQNKYVFFKTGVVYESQSATLYNQIYLKKGNILHIESDTASSGDNAAMISKTNELGSEYTPLIPTVTSILDLDWSVPEDGYYAVGVLHNKGCFIQVKDVSKLNSYIEGYNKNNSYTAKDISFDSNNINTNADNVHDALKDAFGGKDIVKISSIVGNTFKKNPFKKNQVVHYKIGSRTGTNVIQLNNKENFTSSGSQMIVPINQTDACEGYFTVNDDYLNVVVYSDSEDSFDVELDAKFSSSIKKEEQEVVRQMNFIDNRLKTLYPERLINSREFIEVLYDYGNMFLSNSFYKPQLNEDVEISINDASSLKQGEKICIGNLQNYDVYQINNITDNKLSIKLIESLSEYYFSGNEVPAEISMSYESKDTYTEKINVYHYEDIISYQNGMIPRYATVDEIHPTDDINQALGLEIARKIRPLLNGQSRIVVYGDSWGAAQVYPNAIKENLGLELLNRSVSGDATMHIRKRFLQDLEDGTVSNDDFFIFEMGTNNLVRFNLDISLVINPVGDVKQIMRDYIFHYEQDLRYIINKTNGNFVIVTGHAGTNVSRF